jgi:hypothetical protein
VSPASIPPPPSPLPPPARQAARPRLPERPRRAHRDGGVARRGLRHRRPGGHQGGGSGGWEVGVEGAGCWVPGCWALGTFCGVVGLQLRPASLSAGAAALTPPCAPAAPSLTQGTQLKTSGMPAYARSKVAKAAAAARAMRLARLIWMDPRPPSSSPRPLPCTVPPHPPPRPSSHPHPSPPPQAMQIMFSHELQRRLRLAGKDVDCFAVHPGAREGGAGKSRCARPARSRLWCTAASTTVCLPPRPPTWWDHHPCRHGRDGADQQGAAAGHPPGSGARAAAPLHPAPPRPPPRSYPPPHPSPPNPSPATLPSPPRPQVDTGYPMGLYTYALMLATGQSPLQARETGRGPQPRAAARAWGRGTMRSSRPLNSLRLLPMPRRPPLFPPLPPAGRDERAVRRDRAGAAGPGRHLHRPPGRWRRGGRPRQELAAACPSPRPVQPVAALLATH